MKIFGGLTAFSKISVDNLRYINSQKNRGGCQSYPRPHTQVQGTFSGHQEPTAAGVKEVCQDSKRKDNM